MLRGIDISYANDIVDYDKLINQIDFAIIRAGYGRLKTQEDKKYREHLNNLKAREIPCGAYWYSYAHDVDEAKEEAYACLEVLKNTRFEYPIYFDVEEIYHSKMTAEELTAIIEAFCSTLEKVGFWVGIYSYGAIINKLPLKVLNRYALWYAGIDTLPLKSSGVFQYSWKGYGAKFGQPKGNIDLDICIYDYPKMIKTQHKNNY